jgi:hypothetical protein
MVIARNTGVTNSGGIGAKPLIGTVVFTFHELCDGKIDIPVATGVYAPLSGSSLALELTSG